MILAHQSLTERIWLRASALRTNQQTKFNSKSKDRIHLKLAELSKKAHELAKRYYEQNDLQSREELKEVEGEIDKAVAGLYGITDKELEEVKNNGT